MMNDSLYRETILEHWRNPQNWGTVDEADFMVDDYNPLCGDSIHLTGKLVNGKISEIKFRGKGCVISRATGSILTEYVRGKSVEEIKGLNQKDYLSLMKISLTVARLKCALLPYSALQKALK